MEKNKIANKDFLRQVLQDYDEKVDIDCFFSECDSLLEHLDEYLGALHTTNRITFEDYAACRDDIIYIRRLLGINKEDS